MPKERISVTINESLSSDIQNYAKSKKLSRSELVEDILFQWQKNYKKQQMVEGYKAMAKENLQCAKDFNFLSREVWPNE